MGSRASLNTSPGVNWVERSGGLAPELREVIREVMKTGKTKEAAVGIAISRMRKWAAGGNAKWVKVLAQYEALRARNRARQDVKTAHPADAALLVELARRVRTAEGARRYGKPIGSLIGSVRGPHTPAPDPTTPRQRARRDTADRVAVAEEGVRRETARGIADGRLGAGAKKDRAKAKAQATELEAQDTQRGERTLRQQRGLDTARAAIAAGKVDDLDEALRTMGVQTGRRRLAAAMIGQSNEKALRRLDVVAVRAQLAAVDTRRRAGQITQVEAAKVKAALRRRLRTAEAAAQGPNLSQSADGAVELSQPGDGTEQPPGLVDDRARDREGRVVDRDPARTATVTAEQADLAGVRARELHVMAAVGGNVW